MKRIFNWIISTFAKHYIGIILSGAAISTFALLWNKFVSWLLEETLVSNWLLGIGGFSTTILFVIAVIFLHIKYFRKNKFKPFFVLDETMNFYWKIQKEPAHWIDGDLSGYSESYINSLINGPFCPICKSPIEDNNSTLGGRCILGGHETRKEFKGIKRSEVKEYVIMALQRYFHDTGKNIREKLRFQLFPDYFSDYKSRS